MARVYIGDDNPVEIHPAYKNIKELKEALTVILQNGENLYSADHGALRETIFLVLDVIGSKASEPMDILADLSLLPSKLSIENLLNEPGPVDDREFQSEVNMAKIREMVAIRDAEAAATKAKFVASGRQISDLAKQQFQKYQKKQIELARQQAAAAVATARQKTENIVTAVGRKEAVREPVAEGAIDERLIDQIIQAAEVEKTEGKYTGPVMKPVLNKKQIDQLMREMEAETKKGVAREEAVEKVAGRHAGISAEENVARVIDYQWGQVEREKSTKKAEEVAKTVTERLIKQLEVDGVIKPESRDEVKLREVIRQRVEKNLADGIPLDKPSVWTEGEINELPMTEVIAQALETPTPIVESTTAKAIEKANNNLKEIFKKEQVLTKEINQEIATNLGEVIKGREEELSRLIEEEVGVLIANQKPPEVKKAKITEKLDKILGAAIIPEQKIPTVTKEAEKMAEVAGEINSVAKELIEALDRKDPNNKITPKERQLIAAAIEKNILVSNQNLTEEVALISSASQQEVAEAVGKIANKIDKINAKTTQITDEIAKKIEVSEVVVGKVTKTKLEIAVEDIIIGQATGNRKETATLSLDKKIANSFGVEEGKVLTVKDIGQIEARLTAIGNQKEEMVTELLLGITGAKIVGIKARAMENEKPAELLEMITKRVDWAIIDRSGLEAEISPTGKEVTVSLAEDLAKITRLSPADIAVYVKGANVDFKKQIESNQVEIQIFKRLFLEDKIEKEYRKNNPKATPEQEVAIVEFKKMIGKLFYGDADSAKYKQEAMDFSQKRGNSPKAAEEAWDQTKAMTSLVKMGPKKLKEWSAKYNKLTKILGIKPKIIAKIKELKAVRQITNLIKSSPRLRRVFEVVQRFTSFSSKISNFWGNIGSKFGQTLVEKFGGQAELEFYQQATATMSEQGVVRGFQTVMKGILNGGVKAGEVAAKTGTAATEAGTAVAEAGAAATEAGAVAAETGAVAAEAGTLAAAGGTAATGVGIPIAIILAVLAAVQLVYNSVIKPIVNGFKKLVTGLLQSAGIDASSFKIDIKKFISRDLGLGDNIMSTMLAGGIKVAGGLGILVMGIPAMLAGLSLSFVGVIVALFFVGTMLFSQVLQAPELASLVPPVGMGGGGFSDGSGAIIVAPPDWTPGAVPEGCPDRLPVNGGYFTQGPFAPGCSHQYMSSPAIDIGIGAGSPIYATHAGQARAGSDSIYGNYVEVRGTCNGIEFYTKYAHMPSLPFTGVIDVEAGDQIGEVDNTGSSTGNHIHYHITGLPVDNFCNYLGFTNVSVCEQLWGCCGTENGIFCPLI